MPRQPGRVSTRLQVPMSDELLISSFVLVEASPSYWFEGSGRVCIIMGCGRPNSPEPDWQQVGAGTWKGAGICATVTTEERMRNGLPSWPGFACDQHRAEIEARHQDPR